MITGIVRRLESMGESEIPSPVIGEMVMDALSEIDQVIAGYFQPMATMIAQIFTLVALIFFLVIVDPLVALIAGLSLGSAYGLIFFLIIDFEALIVFCSEIICFFDLSLFLKVKVIEPIIATNKIIPDTWKRKKYLVYNTEPINLVFSTLEKLEK